MRRTMRHLISRGGLRTSRSVPVRAKDALVALVAFLLAAVAPASGEVIDRVLAIVSGESITLSDVRGQQALGIIGGLESADPVQAGLRQLIDRTLILAEVRRFAPPEPGPNEVEARIEEMRRRFGTPAAAARAMAEWGISDDRLRVLARDELRIRSYLAERFTVSDLPTPEQVDEFIRSERAVAPKGEVPSSGASDEAARSSEQRAQSLLLGWIADLRQRADITIPTSAPPR
jgi:hypothetical protein